MNLAFKLQVVSLFFYTLSPNFSWAQAKTQDTKNSAQENMEKKESSGEFFNDKVISPLNSIDYPELQVVPRASERLNTEAKNERDQKLLYHWTFPVSGITTFLASYSLSSHYNKSYDDTSNKEKLDTKNNIVLVGEAVGLSWLALTYYLNEQSMYASAAMSIKKQKGNNTDKRAELMQERLADEAIEHSYQLMKTFTWASVLSNAFVNTAILTAADNISRPYATIGLLSSFLPVIFQHRYIGVYEKQQEYKRKIYAPLVSMNYQYLSPKEGWAPRLTATWTF